MTTLNLQVFSFDFPNNFFKDGDRIRVSATALPEEQKLAETFNVNQMSFVNPCFSFNYSSDINRILVVFRRLSIFKKDPIIASTVIKSSQFPNSLDGSTNEELKTFKVYEPVQKMAIKVNSLSDKKRKVLGKIKIKMSFNDEIQFDTFKRERRNSKTRNGMEYANMIATFD